MTDMAVQRRDVSPAAVYRSSAAPPLCTLITHEADRVLVCLAGELDLATAPALQREVVALCSMPISAITLDLERLTFIDSSGLSALNAIRVATVRHHVDLTLESVSDQALRVFDITGMADLFARTDAPAKRE